MNKTHFFITNTMFSRSNGPANFAINLLKDKIINKKMYFLTPDVEGSMEGVIKSKHKYAKKFKKIAMIMSSLDFYLILRKKSCDNFIWNSSIIPFFTICFLHKKKHTVFVNDSLCVDAAFNFNYRGLRFFIFSYFERFVLRKANKVVVNSLILKEKIVDKYKINPKKVTLLYKGLDLSEISTFKDDFSINKEEVKVVFTKSDYVVGGLLLLCNALSLLNYKFKLYVIGPEKLGSIYFNFSNIELIHLGKLNKKSVYKTLISADIFCVPCLVEAFGQANIEALYSRVPTILLPTENQKNIHSNNYSYFASGFDCKALSEVITDTIELEADVRQAKALLAHNAIQEKYSFFKTALDFINII